MTKPKLSSQKYAGIGQVPIGIGAVLRGWDLTEEEKINGLIGTVDFRAMTAACPHNCFYCFTDKQKKTLTLKEVKDVIDQIVDIGTIGINYLGEGEPTIDPNFFEIIKYTDNCGLIPIVFTDAATKLRDREFVSKLKQYNVSVAPKCDSLFDAEYQNFVIGDKTGRYFYERKQALELLTSEGFNEVKDDGTTRLGFDMIVSKRNISEVEKTLRYCRDNNMWIVFSCYLPSGRSAKNDFDKSLVLGEEEKQKMREVIKRVDLEYGFSHPIYNNFATFPCGELIQIYGDGRVSPCPGNETIVGNVKTDSLVTLKQKIIEGFPCHNPKTFDGHCLYRPKIPLEKLR